jgi:hypothetical protein
VGVFNEPIPGTQRSGYRNLGMGPISVQNTGNVPMHNMHMGGGMNMGGHMGGHMGGGMMGMGGMNMGYGQHQHHPQPNRNQAPVYNPHQHVQFPYSPQPMDIDPQTTRGMPYTGPGVHHYAPGPAPMHGGPGGHTGQMSVNHTGMSGMSHMTQTYQSRMNSPLPLGMQTPMHHPHAQHHGGPAHHGQQSGHMVHGGQPMHVAPSHQPHLGMMPYQAQPHMHAGMGGPMGMHNGMGMQGMQGGMGMGGGGMGMTMGMSHQGAAGPFGSTPHPGLSVHSGEQGVLGKANQVWITGEFFGVQRARDMLLNVAVQKVGNRQAK